MTPAEELRILQENLRHVEELEKTRGWKLLVSVMENEIQTATTKMVAPGPRKDDFDYLRGVIYAANRCLELPARYKAGLKNDILIATSKAPPKPGKE